MDLELENQMKMLEEMYEEGTLDTDSVFTENELKDITKGVEEELSMLDMSSNIQIPESIQKIKNKLNIKIHTTKLDESKPDSNVKARYLYIDEKGIIRYRISRFFEPNKDGNLFAVDSPNDKGGFKAGAKGIPRIPYNIPQLLNAKGRTIFIVNGEDKVEIIKQLGFVATTAAFSSPQKWEKNFNKYLSNGSYIIILADNKEDTSYIKFLDYTLETIQEDYQNVGRIDLSDYFDFFEIDSPNVKTLTDLVKIVPKEKVIEFFTDIENEVKKGVV